MKYQDKGMAAPFSVYRAAAPSFLSAADPYDPMKEDVSVLPGKGKHGPSPVKLRKMLFELIWTVFHDTGLSFFHIGAVIGQVELTIYARDGAKCIICVRFRRPAFIYPFAAAVQFVYIHTLVISGDYQIDICVGRNKPNLLGIGPVRGAVDCFPITVFVYADPHLDHGFPLFITFVSGKYFAGGYYCQCGFAYALVLKTGILIRSSGRPAADKIPS